MPSIGQRPDRGKRRPTLTPPVPLDQALEFLRDDLERVESFMLEGMRSVAPLIPRVGEYTFGSGGKRVRPALVLLGARLFGCAGERPIAVAAAAEWLHSASLLHDDVVDGARLRRGRASAHTVFGPRQAILVGDYLYARVCQVLVENGNREILRRYSQSIADMAEGEVLQLGRSFALDVDEPTYFEVIGRKTASLLATSAESGAILGDAPPEEQAAVREYGWQLGLAFQLVDDALDYASSADELGKAPLGDLREGTITLPLLLALSDAAETERAVLGAALHGLAASAASGAAPDAEAVGCVTAAVAQHAGVERTLARARACAERAVDALAGLAEGPARGALEILVRFVVERRS